MSDGDQAAFAAHLDSHLSDGALVETVHPAGQRALRSHQTRRLPPEVLKTRGEQVQARFPAALQNRRRLFCGPGAATARRRSGR